MDFKKETWERIVKRFSDKSQYEILWDFVNGRRTAEMNTQMFFVDIIKTLEKENSYNKIKELNYYLNSRQKED